MNVINFVLNSTHCDANMVLINLRESADLHSCHAKGWFNWKTKFTFKGMSPTNHLCMVRQASKCLITALKVFT